MAGIAGSPLVAQRVRNERIRLNSSDIRAFREDLIDGASWSSQVAADEIDADLTINMAMYVSERALLKWRGRSSPV